MRPSYPLVRVYARLWKRPSEKLLQGTLVYKPAAGHYNSGKCFIVIFGYSPSVEGWIPKVVHGVSCPQSYSTRKPWRCGSVFAAPLLTPPDFLGVSHGQPSEIAHSLRRNLGMSGIDRLLVSCLCQVVRSPLLQEHS
jgi:hypothetical protein